MGLLEGFHRTLFHYPLGFGSVAAGFLTETGILSLDMRKHQYLPVVYPFTRGLIRGKVHHAIHHYGSYLPVESGGGSNLDRDDAAGSVRNNPKPGWLCRMTEHIEGSLDSETSAFLGTER